MSLRLTKCEFVDQMPSLSWKRNKALKQFENAAKHIKDPLSYLECFQKDLLYVQQLIEAYSPKLSVKTEKNLSCYLTGLA